MKRKNTMALLGAMGFLVLLGPCSGVLAQSVESSVQSQAATNQIRDFQIAEQGGSLLMRLSFARPLAELPKSFTVTNPSRIAIDFPQTQNALGRVQQTINRGAVRSVNIVESGTRTRMVLNLTRMADYESRIEGGDLVIAIVTAGDGGATSAASSPAENALANFSASAAGEATEKSVHDITFRRGEGGEGRVVVQLSSPDTGVNVLQQGTNLVVEFSRTSLPEHLQRRSDLTDFGTPISRMTAQMQGDNARLVVTPNGLWEHSAYQTDGQFVLEVRRLEEDPNRLVQSAGRDKYAGEKLSLNFQDVEIRSVLQVIADFTDFNIVTSDSVAGNLTLRLNDVPWDQALDIILQAKGLDKRKSGNVIWIAPSDELASREQQQLEALSQRGDLEPLVTESFQVNYHNGSEIADFLKSQNQTVLSPRGSVVVDARSNKIFATDVPSRLDALRRLIQEIDVPPRQVLIEARIVEANKGFTKDLGVRMNFGSNGAVKMGGTRLGLGSVSNGALTGDGGQTGGNTPVSNFSILNLALFNSSATKFLNLELSALETDSRGRIVSSPRVLTANQKEALIEQGTEVPYQESTSSGATNIQFKKAVLSLRVKPQITPDGRVQLDVTINKDRPDFANALGGVPPILTKNVKTDVLVENGGTVVIGGIFEEEDTTAINRVPLLGELPIIGALFRNTERVSTRTELLVFITPRIVTESLTLR